MIPERDYNLTFAIPVYPRGGSTNSAGDSGIPVGDGRRSGGFGVRQRSRHGGGAGPRQYHASALFQSIPVAAPFNHPSRIAGAPESKAHEVAQRIEPRQTQRLPIAHRTPSRHHRSPSAVA